MAPTYHSEQLQHLLIHAGNHILQRCPFRLTGNSNSNGGLVQMQRTHASPVHPRHAQLVEGLHEYLEATGKSARWLGLVTAGNPRLVPGLIRGQTYPAKVMLSLATRLVDFYTAQLEAEQAQTLPRAA